MEMLLLREGKKKPTNFKSEKVFKQFFFAGRFPTECFNSFSLLSLSAAGSGLDLVSCWVVRWEDPG